MSDPVITWVREPGDPTWLRYEGLTIAQACEKFAAERFRLLDLHETSRDELTVEATRSYGQAKYIDGYWPGIWPMKVRRETVLTVTGLRGNLLDTSETCG